ncbi:MAG: NADH-quinone oxidoreductase subunit C [SAR202 cluster bacterium]|jgi:NADH/F420H2 dehydrogenase subunit C|nr:NADH-quinone oxidoreductase subunit C [Chloroflexota bacterium]MDP6421357.1 NADH-quinone oxidoreductase subunit C [SAR202 cluster bacterium]HAL48048.1 NADH-quinone oxidoreductase subunit C [Dehalococcoidia bacterium]MDP6665588.1 NADH-quinone oxidoreductase subunit C [SAR202 cluster bacterium]MDP6799229.1 NADH-quinone oxidoreductase subunit C [SAR202 cluster bacterium]|tara:strand:+ start:15023 stop:15466 length:444 start_codon:yes stop_codon:yes gene_type:complete
MTKALSGGDVASRINEAISDAVVDHNDTDVWIDSESLLDASRFLKTDADLDFAYLTAVSAVDYIEYFELVYHLLSTRYNHSVVVKSKLFGREAPTVSSVTGVWRGADLQEREVWDLMGIRFEGHPNLKRVMLWEGFPGHPLRKDYVE